MNKAIEENRLGKFKITRDFFDSLTKSEKEAFDESVFIIKSKLTKQNGLIEHTAASEKFDTLEKTEIVPYYTGYIKRGEDFQLEWSRVK